TSPGGCASSLSGTRRTTSCGSDTPWTARPRTLRARAAELPVRVDVVDGGLDGLVDLGRLRVVLDDLVRHDTLAGAVQVLAGPRLRHLGGRHQREPAVRQVARLRCQDAAAGPGGLDRPDPV